MSEQVQTHEEPGFNITVQKQNPLSGEAIVVVTNIPKGSTSEDIRKAIDCITQAIDWRIPNDQAIEGIVREKLALLESQSPAQ